VINPIFWLVLSFLLVSVSLTAVLVVLVPAVVELSRAARSFEKLCDTIDRDLPPTLEAIRQTTAEIARLTDEVNVGVHNAGRVAQHVDQSVSSVRSQAKRAQVSTRSLMAGMGAAWSMLTKPETPSDRPPHPASPPYRTGGSRSHSPQRSPAQSTPAPASRPTQPPPTAPHPPTSAVAQPASVAAPATDRAPLPPNVLDPEATAATDPHTAQETP